MGLVIIGHAVLCMLFSSFLKHETYISVETCLCLTRIYKFRTLHRRHHQRGLDFDGGPLFLERGHAQRDWLWTRDNHLRCKTWSRYTTPTVSVRLIWGIFDQPRVHYFRQSFKISEIFHPEEAFSDIVLIRLEKSIDFATTKAGVVCLPSENWNKYEEHNYYDTKCYAAGFGYRQRVDDLTNDYSGDACGALIITPIKKK